MKPLKDILYGVSLSAVSGSTGVIVNTICFDSRKVAKGSVFVAIKGTLTDGHKYIDKAISAGAISIVCEELPGDLINNITYVEVLDANQALAVMASNFYDN